MKRMFAATAAAALMMSLAACGGSDDGSSEGDGGLKKVTFGVAPVAPTGALQLGVDKGFFKEEGIELEIKPVQGGAAVLPGVMAGDPMYATSNAITLITARDQGLPVKIATPWSADRVKPDKGMYGVVSPKGSDIKSIIDLKGKTVATNTLRGLGDFTVSTALQNAGGDPELGEVHRARLPGHACGPEEEERRRGVGA